MKKTTLILLIFALLLTISNITLGTTKWFCMADGECDAIVGNVLCIAGDGVSDPCWFCHCKAGYDSGKDAVWCESFGNECWYTGERESECVGK